jgi:hypothetical protein
LEDFFSDAVSVRETSAVLGAVFFREALGAATAFFVVFFVAFFVAFFAAFFFTAVFLRALFLAAVFFVAFLAAFLAVFFVFVGMDKRIVEVKVFI